MNNNSFRKEINNYINQAYDEFEESQSIVKEIFGVFHEICKNNNFHYYYGYGSLLGIVRDDGMIPWDCDIDVFVPVNCMPKLIRLLKRYLPPEYYVMSDFIDKDFYLCESRICKKNYDSSVYHVDIFYLIGAPNDEKKLRGFDKKIKRMYYLRCLRNQEIDKGKTRGEKLIYYIKRIIKLVLHIEPGFIFNKKCRRLMFKYNFDKSKKCVVWYERAEIIPVDALEPVNVYEHEKFQCFLPNNPDACLRNTYPNYKKYMPIGTRFDEFYCGYKRFLGSRVDV